ncbi:hypothetical protein P9112_009125 [Eukaryota sp. TZLM1-RC]
MVDVSEILKDVSVEFTPMFWTAVATIILSPLIWNIVSRLEYNTRFMTKIFGNKTVACYIFAIYVFFFSLFRDIVFKFAVVQGSDLKHLIPEQLALPHLILTAILYVVGGVLVLGSSIRLKIIGTYCGDYFDIFPFDAPIKSFPFNVCNNPMYVGSSLLFLAFAVQFLSPTGFILTALTAIVYKVALFYEEPFTQEIYKKKAEMEKKD